MAMLSPVSRRATALTGRRSERDVLDGLIEAVGAGESRALVLRGEPGVGKTALLEYLVEQAPAFRVARGAVYRHRRARRFGRPSASLPGARRIASSSASPC